MTLQEAIKFRILELCKENNLTINGLAMKSGMTQSTVNNLVNGTSKNPTVQTILRICWGVEIELEDFFKSDVFKKIYE